MRYIFFGVVLILTCSVWQQAQAAEPEIRPAHQKMIADWVERHPQYRLASLDDCQCEEGVAEMRKGWGLGKAKHPAQRDYLPYYIQGSFDGRPGFAALFRSVSTPFSAKIVVFSLAQERGRILDFPFASEGSLEQVGLFRAGKTLMVGEFGSESEVLKVPQERN